MGAGQGQTASATARECNPVTNETLALTFSQTAIGGSPTAKSRTAI
jgi:hypothetical protein